MAYEQRVIVAIAIAGCGRLDIQPVPCNWLSGPIVGEVQMRPELSTPVLDSDPLLVHGDPLTMYVTSDGGTGNNDIYVTKRPSLDAPFGPMTLISELTTAQSEYALQLDVDGHGYFAKYNVTNVDLFEVQRDAAGTIQIVRALDEINDSNNQHDPQPTADGLTLWFSYSNTSTDQDIKIAHRTDRDAPWGAIEPFVYNTNRTEAGATLTADQRVVVWAARSERGDMEILYATRTSLVSPWSAPHVLEGVSTPDQFEFEPSIREDGCELFFVRSSNLTDRNWNIYSVTIE